MKQTLRKLHIVIMAVFAPLLMNACPAEPGKGPEFYASFPSVGEVIEWFENNIHRISEDTAHFGMEKKPGGYWQRNRVLSYCSPKKSFPKASRHRTSLV